jgi:hypothetical protein
MKKQSVLLLLVVVAGVAIISFGQSTSGEKPLPNQQVAEMQNQINALQARIQALEGRMKGLESTVQQLKQPRLQPLTSPGENSLWLNPPAASPKPPIFDSKPPKIWGEREINGWTFYIVPCGEQGHGQDESQGLITPSR